MYLKITNTTTGTLKISCRDDFHLWEYDDSKIIIENMRGVKIPFAAQRGVTIELMEGFTVIHCLPALTSTSPELLYREYQTKTGKKATYEKKGVAIEYADYKRWLAKQHKGREY